MKATKRSILQNKEMRFRSGIFSEDVEWCGRYFAHIQSVALINRPCYFYRKRGGSITTSITEKNIRDLFSTLQHQSAAIRYSSMSDKRKRALLMYHSYQFFILLGLTQEYLAGAARKSMLNELRPYSWLADYSKSKKTRPCAMLLKIFGITITSKILGRYIKSR